MSEKLIYLAPAVALAALLFAIFPLIMHEIYQKEIPGKLLYLKMMRALRAYGNVVAFHIADVKLKQQLDVFIDERLNSDANDKITSKYDQDYPGAFLCAATPYTTVGKQ